ncbi:hypothetical protein U4E84_07565 [Halorubrum sp. AD140]|uniref:hypothetical protein n=1 Tax=Halorubrum sp. AD140 TaxID=3050073 RepID=UPI002ACC7FB9|nr:hypothetical protein [Halorubrum sp. AD140]MDZ5811202.1 hypothetical protein [Halorubrum sp. AD140]
MKRRALLAVLAPTTVGCLDSDVLARGSLARKYPESSDVESTPDGVDAVYRYFSDSSGDDPTFDAEVITDASMANAYLTLPEEVTEFAVSVDYDDSYLVIAPRSVGTWRDAREVSVDAFDRTEDEAHAYVRVHTEDEADALEGNVGYVLIVVSGDRDPPESARAEWFEASGRCEDTYAPYHRLPPVVRREVDIALSDGRYETDTELFYPAAVAADSTLWKENEYFTHQIDDRGGTTVLTFDPTDGESADSPVTLSVHNGRDEPLDMSVVVADEHGDRHVDERLTAESHDIEHLFPGDGSFPAEATELPSVELPTAFDEYDLSIETAGGEEFTESFRIDPDQQTRFVSFRDEGEESSAVVMRSEFEIERAGDGPVGVCTDVGGWWGEYGEV